MRKVIIEIYPSTHEVELIEDDGYTLDPDSLYDFFIHETVSQPNYDWKVVDEDGNDVTKEYEYPSE